MGGHHAGRAADAARGVHPQHRLAHRAERIGEVKLGHHHALEHVRGLADHDRVDVRPSHPGVLERALGRLTDQSRDRDVLPLRGVLGLADPDDRHSLAHAASRSRTATRFCCRHGPLRGVRKRPRARPAATAVAAAASRSRPPTIIGPAAASTG